MEVKNVLKSDAVAPWRSVLLCGPSGSMKTITSSMFPEPQCWIASNPGQMCGFPMVTWKKLKANPDNFVLKASETRYKEIVDFINKNSNNFNSWILDDMTYLQHLFLAEKKGGKPKASYDDWGFILEWSREIVTLTSEIKGHQIIIALEQLVKDEVEGKIVGLPNVFGKFAHDLPALVRTALHITAQPTTAGDPKRFVHATPDLFWSWCKDREGILSPREPHPDWVLKFLLEESENGAPNSPA